uniref:GNAT family N-acetyltransferase n=1 Tax=uncultured Megasphaera sp. TaxID=165188 RepID=UPI002659BB55
ETFAPLCAPADMQAYLEQAFAREKIREELENSCSSFYFLYADTKLAGYIKVNAAPAQTDLHDEQSLELERIYVSPVFQGCGLGRVLLFQAVRLAKMQHKAYIWLGVWEKNAQALRFYRKNGFYVIGTHSFWMGNDEQTDYLMRKDLLVKEDSVSYDS